MSVLDVWISAFLTLAIFSFLYRDNPIYKFAEHLFIGVSAGYFMIQQIESTLYPQLYQPIADAAMGKETGQPWRVGGLILSILLLMRLSNRTSWISRWPLALMIGVFAGLRLTGYAQSDLVEQVNRTMIPLSGETLPWFSWQGASVLNNWLMVIGVLSVLVYFFFSVERKTPVKQVAGLGTFFLMVTFGASFGYTVLGRISLLIGRVQDLYIFAQPRYGYASIACAVGIVCFLAVWRFRLEG